MYLGLRHVLMCEHRGLSCVALPFFSLVSLCDFLQRENKPIVGVNELES